MGKCIYCGGELPQIAVKAKAHTRYYDVCSNECGDKLHIYIEKDKKYKLPMFLIIFVGGAGFLISALFGQGDKAMSFAYIGQILAGFAFLLLPFPILFFETFHSVAIKKVTLISRIIGVFFIIWGMVLSVFTLS